jgi:hypothetical protein
MLWLRSQRQGLNTIYFMGGSWRKAFIGVNAMNKEMTSQVEADEEILTFDIQDAVLERAGSAEQRGFARRRPAGCCLRACWKQIVGGACGFLYALILLRIGHLPNLPPGVKFLPNLPPGIKCCVNYERGRLFPAPLFHQQDGKRLPARAS